MLTFVVHVVGVVGFLSCLSWRVLLEQMSADYLAQHYKVLIPITDVHRSSRSWRALLESGVHIAYEGEIENIRKRRRKRKSSTQNFN